MNKTFAALFALVGVVALAGVIIWQLQSDDTAPNADMTLTLQNTWQLTKIGGVDPTAPITLTIAGGQASGQAPCNGYSGPVNSDKETIDFGPMISTMMACDELDLEVRYMQTLDQVAGYQINGTTLQLTDAGGQALLTYEYVQQ